METTCSPSLSSQRGGDLHFKSEASFLADHVDEVEALAEEELDCPVAVLAAELHALAHVARHQLDPVRPRVLVVDHLVQTHDHVLKENSMLAYVLGIGVSNRYGMSKFLPYFF